MSGKERNPYLTPAMEKVLRWMVVDSDGELVVEGREAWYGLHRTSPSVVNNLLRLCLIRDEGGDGFASESRMRRYSVNEEGRKIVSDPEYRPQVLEAIKKALKK